jgi:hypothetical protein
MEADAGAIKAMIMPYFQSRIGKVTEAADIEFLEKRLPGYAAGVCKRADEGERADQGLDFPLACRGRWQRWHSRLRWQ